MELIVPSAVSVVAVGLYVVALWIGSHRTISTLTDASNLAAALVVVATGLASAVGLQWSADLVASPDRFLLAVSRLIEYV
jgi:hypothetical protein